MSAYVVFEIQVTNQEGYASYRPLAAASIEQYGGEFIVRGGNPQPLEGGWEPERIVIVRFDSEEQLRRWYESPEYTHAKAIRQANSNDRGVVVSGV